jgi:hypothetical protein
MSPAAPPPSPAPSRTGLPRARLDKRKVRPSEPVFRHR